jgi:hypothetical protein
MGEMDEALLPLRITSCLRTTAIGVVPDGRIWPAAVAVPM